MSWLGTGTNMWQSQWGTTPLLINESQMAMQTIKKLHRFTSIQKPHILSQKQMTT